MNNKILLRLSGLCTLTGVGLLYLALTGCNSPNINKRTDLGIEINDNGYSVNSQSVDKLVLDAEKCLNNNGFKTRNDYNNMKINIELYGVDEKGHELIDRYGNTGEYTGEIYTTPNLASLKHEVIHWNGYRGNYNKAILKCQN